LAAAMLAFALVAGCKSGKAGDAKAPEGDALKMPPDVGAKKGSMGDASKGGMKGPMMKGGTKQGTGG
jgi:hypothetical protein